MWSILFFISVNAISFHCCDEKAQPILPVVQIILFLGRSLTDILCNFDVDACCVAYVPEKKKVFCLPRAMRAIRFSANLVNTSIGGESYTRRASINFT